MCSKAAADGLQEVQTPGGDDEDVVVKQQLQNLYDSVKDLPAAAYTAESWQAFQTARDAAQAVLSDPEATQEDVSEAYHALYSAWQNLKSAQQGGSDVQNPDNTKPGQDAQNPDSTKPAESGKTGDTAPIIPLAVAAAAAAAVIALIFARRRTMK